MNITLFIQNLKCRGCANTITKNLEAIPSVSSVTVDNEDSSVRFSYQNEQTLDKVKKKLTSLGYPTVDAENGNLTKLKSVVSCAIGKIN